MSDEPVKASIESVRQTLAGQRDDLSVLLEDLTVFENTLPGFLERFKPEQMERLQKRIADISEVVPEVINQHHIRDYKDVCYVDLRVMQVQSMITRLRAVCDVINAQADMSKQWPENDLQHDVHDAEKQYLDGLFQKASAEHERIGDLHGQSGAGTLDLGQGIAFMYARETQKKPETRKLVLQEGVTYFERLQQGRIDYAESCMQSSGDALRYANRIIHATALFSQVVKGAPPPVQWMAEAYERLKATAKQLDHIEEYLDQVEKMVPAGQARPSVNVPAVMRFDL